MFRHPLHHHHIGKSFDHLRTRPPAFSSYQQTFSAVFIDQVQHAHCPSVVGFGAHEVVTPHMVGMHRPQPNARAVVEPQPASWSLPLRNLQALTSPDALDAVLADPPAVALQERRDAAIAIPAILTGKIDDGSRKSIFVLTLRRPIALRASRLIHQSACSAFTQSLSLSMVHRRSSAL